MHFLLLLGFAHIIILGLWRYWRIFYHSLLTPGLPKTQIIGPVVIRNQRTFSASPYSIHDCTFEQAKKRHFVRKSLPYRADSPVKFNRQGIDGSFDWHRSEDAENRASRTVEERAICINSTSHYYQMRSFYEPSSFFRVRIPSYPETGENILVGPEFNIDSLCLGDVIACDQAPTLKLVVTHVRRPCQRFASLYSKQTFLRIMRQGLGGVFLAVKNPGELSISEATLYVIERKHPEWPLKRVNRLIYGESGFDKQPKWLGNDSELDALLRIPEFGEFQWKDYLRSVYDEKKHK